jgi:prepilin-type N-terminal cleavage/methylation domain-containing protein
MKKRAGVLGKGFTLAELLIVVAIIAVLVAIAIPIFNNRLEASREATDVAMLRQAYTAAILCQNQGTFDDGYKLNDNSDPSFGGYQGNYGVYNPQSGKVVSSHTFGVNATERAGCITVKTQAKVDGWQGRKPDWNTNVFENKLGYPYYEGINKATGGTIRSSSEVCTIKIRFDGGKVTRVFFSINGQGL